MRMDIPSLAMTLMALLEVFGQITEAQLMDPYEFDYILQPNTSCHETEFDLLIWFHTNPVHRRHRMALRETWANSRHTQTHGQLKSKVLFFMGYTQNDTLLQSQLEYESEVYQDIVQESYIDHYHNLTYKAMSALKWITSNCDPAKYKLVLKADDDVLVDNGRMVWFLRHYIGFPRVHENMIVCNTHENVSVQRNTSLKWYVSEEEFPRDYFPEYCAGMVVLLTSDLIERMWSKAQNVSLLWVDDVFLTGILLENMKVTWRRVNSVLVYQPEHTKFSLANYWATKTFIHVSPMVFDTFYKLYWGRFSGPNGFTEELNGEFPVS